jgi:hypothetical protein
MKNLLVSLLFLPMMAFVVSDWVAVRLDDHVSVEFPSTPINSESQGHPVWVQDVDSNSRCMAMIVDFAQYGLDSMQLQEELKKPEMYEVFRNNLIAQLPGAKVMSEKNTLTDGRITYEFAIDMNKNDNELNYLYNRNIFFGTKVYSMSFYEKKNAPRINTRNKFFNSFLVNGR